MRRIIKACASSSPAFLMMYSAYKLNITYMWTLKNDTNELICFVKQKQTDRYRKQIYGYQRGNMDRVIRQEFGINRNIPVYIP